MPGFQKPAPGTKIRQTPIFQSSFQGALVDLVNATKPAPVDPTIYGNPTAGIVKVRNDTSADLERGQAVQLGDFLLNNHTPTHFWYSGEAVEVKTGKPVAITLEPIPKGDIGQAMLEGICLAVVDGSNPVHQYATPADGSTICTAGTEGPIRILSEVQPVGVQVIGVHVKQWSKAESISFTLDEDMGATTSGQATATLNDYYRGFDPSDDDGKIVVYDHKGLYVRSLSGGEGLATYDSKSNEYHITDCEKEVVMYKGQVVGAMATTDSTKSVDNLSPMGEGQTTTDSSKTANNIFSGEADDNGDVLIIWNQSSWDLVTGECVAEE